MRLHRHTVSVLYCIYIIGTWLPTAESVSSAYTGTHMHMTFWWQQPHRAYRSYHLNIICAFAVSITLLHCIRNWCWCDLKGEFVTTKTLRTLSVRCSPLLLCQWLVAYPYMLRPNWRVHKRVCTAAKRCQNFSSTQVTVIASPVWRIWIWCWWRFKGEFETAIKNAALLDCALFSFVVVPMALLYSHICWGRFNDPQRVFVVAKPCQKFFPAHNIQFGVGFG